MRRVILLFAAVLLSSVGWSQTMTITFDDGSTVKYDMNKVKSIDFTSDDSGNNQETTPSIVGTWLGISGQGWGLEGNGDSELPILDIRNDGTFIVVKRDEDEGIAVERGRWAIENGNWVLYRTEGKYKGTALEYSIVTLTAETLVLRILGFTGTYKRISSSVLDKYADIIANYDIGEVEFDVNGRTAYEDKNYKDESHFFTADKLGSTFYFHSPGTFDFYTFAYTFPSSIYGRVQASYFYVGFSDFSNIIFEIETTKKNVYGEYVSGNAVVVENDGKYIGIRFDNYKCSAILDGETYYFTIVSGIVKFKIS